MKFSNWNGTLYLGKNIEQYQYFDELFQKMKRKLYFQSWQYAYFYM